MKRLIYIFLLVFVFLNPMAQAQDTQEYDSLVNLYNSLKDKDLRKMEACCELAQYGDDYDSMLVWGHRLLDLALKNRNHDFEVFSYYNIGQAYYGMDEYENAIEYFLKASELISSFNSKMPLLVTCHKMAAYSYWCLGLYPQSDEQFMQGYQVAKDLADTSLMSSILVYVAGNSFTLRSYERAENLFEECIRLDSAIGNMENLQVVYDNLANMYLCMFYENFSSIDTNLILKSEYSSKKAIELPVNDYAMRFWDYCSLVEAMFLEYTEMNRSSAQRKVAIDSMRHCLAAADSLALMEDMNDDIFHLSLRKTSFEILAGNLWRARQMLDSLGQVLDSYQIPQKAKKDDYYLIRYYYYLATGDKANAYYHKTLFFERKLSDASVDYAVSASRSFDESKFHDEIILRENMEYRRRMYFWSGLAVLFIILAFVVNGYFRKRRHNRELNEKNQILTQQREEILQQTEEINAQKEELAERNELITNKNKQITDSINYASIIQRAVMPKDYRMKELFNDYFLIYRPLHIVAGDFYWAKKLGKYTVLVCADCTGHGVPGAFVSMLGVSVLNEVCASLIPNGANAGEVLDMLRIKLMDALGQSKALYEQNLVTNMDGMDLCLAIIDYDSMTLQYAGAYRPLWILRDGQVLQYKADRMPIGLFLGKERPFTNNVIEIRKNDVLYMFSDGIPDQFGYDDPEMTNLKHFTSRRLQEIVESVGHRPLSEQKVCIEEAVDDWSKNYRQIDDNIMIGVRI